MVDEDMDKDKSPDEVPFGADTLYHTAYVVKDYPHEVRHQLPQGHLKQDDSTGWYIY